MQLILFLVFHSICVQHWWDFRYCKQYRNPTNLHKVTLKILDLEVCHCLEIPSFDIWTSHFHLKKHCGSLWVSLVSSFLSWGTNISNTQEWGGGQTFLHGGAIIFTLRGDKTFKWWGRTNTFTLRGVTNNFSTSEGNNHIMLGWWWLWFCWCWWRLNEAVTPFCGIGFSLSSRASQLTRGLNWHLPSDTCVKILSSCWHSGIIYCSCGRAWHCLSVLLAEPDSDSKVTLQSTKPQDTRVMKTLL